MGAFAPDSRGPRLLRIVATPTPGKSVEDLEAAIYAEIEQVKTAPIADWEMDKARNGARRQVVGDLAQSLVRAINLAEYALFFNDPNKINTRWSQLSSMSAADVQRVATRYLTADNRSVIVTRPKAPAGRGGVQ